MNGFSGGTLQIEHQCPQCGGPVILEETDRFMSCAFCRVNLFIVTGDFSRYYLPPSTHPLEETIFIPYWRFRGMRFVVRPFNIKHKLFDTSFLASDHTFMPGSMGFRTQTQKLKFASKKMKTGFLKPAFSRDRAFLMAEKKTGFSDDYTDNAGVFHKAFIGETVSMIYSPVYLKNDVLYDGALDRPLTRNSGHIEQRLRERDTSRNWGIKFISALCPDCGGDLSGARDSIALICRNCNSAWRPAGGNMKRVEFRVFAGKEEEAVYLPFWKMSVEVRGLELASFADLIRAANLPRAVNRELEEKRLYFYSPAFKMHPRIFLRLGTRMTIIQPYEESGKEFPKTMPCPVALDDREAFETVKVMLASMSAAKRKIFPLLPGMEIIPMEATLVYFPFNISGSELVHTGYKFSIPRNAIRNMDIP